MNLSLFQGLLHVTYGYNLQAEETVGGGRKYFGIGVSLSAVVTSGQKAIDE